MIDKALTRFGIGLALLLMVSELTYINAKSLTYMVQELGQLDKYFAVIGSLAFSVVTIIIMRTADNKWPKVVFPLFDVLLVFCGFNLKFYNAIMAGTDNEVRFWLSIFLALFTGFITYCLGIINYEKHAKSNTSETEAKQLELIRRIDVSENKRMETKRLADELTAKQNESNRIIDELKAKQAESNRMVSETKAIASQFVRNHILYEAWMSKKRSVTNRNGTDELMNQLAERIKGGESISIDEYFKSIKN